jgi:RNA polymerase sigma-70 factor (ECF subfamily)
VEVVMADERTLAFQVLLAQSGDRQALETLLAAVQGPLHGYLRRLLDDAHHAEDVLQDVLVLICRKLIWLREPEVFRPWAYRIASRAALRALKRRGGRERAATAAELLGITAPEPPGGAYPPEWIDRLPELIGTLSPASRAVLILHYSEGLSLDEIAAVLEIPRGTVKSRLAYGLSVLRERAGALGWNDLVEEGHTWR